jgi:hypothetical protein
MNGWQYLIRDCHDKPGSMRGKGMGSGLVVQVFGAIN